MKEKGAERRQNPDTRPTFVSGGIRLPSRTRQSILGELYMGVAVAHASTEARGHVDHE